MPIFSPGLSPAGAGRFWDDMPAEGVSAPAGPLFSISGVTRDKNGNPLGSCTVKVFRTATDVEVAQTVSDGSGNFTIPNLTGGDTYYLVAYLSGAPDVAGTSLNTLVAAEIN